MLLYIGVKSEVDVEVLLLFLHRRLGDGLRVGHIIMRHLLQRRDVHLFRQLAHPLLCIGNGLYPLCAGTGPNKRRAQHHCSRVGILFHNILVQIPVQHALQGRLGIHGAAGGNGNQKNIANQKADGHPLFVQ